MENPATGLQAEFAPPGAWPRRYTVVALLALATAVCYVDRVNISIAIIPLARDRGYDAAATGLILSSFFWGYIGPQMLGGWLSDRFGGKRVLSLGVLLWSLGTLLTPAAAEVSFGALLAMRAVLGLGESVHFPTVHSLAARWTIASERSRAISLYVSGVSFGTAVALVASPVIVLSLGWPAVFYISGVLGGRPCVVVGGDAVAETRIKALLEAGASVTVISSQVTDWIKLQAALGMIRHLAREYQSGDLRGNSLAYVTATNPEVIRAPSVEARELGIPLNVKDDSKASSFISPATFRRGNLQIAISTSGASPAMARLIRESLERQIGPEYGLILEILRRARIFVYERQPDQSIRARILKGVAAELVGSIGTLDDTTIDQVLYRHLQTSMAEIGFDPHNSALAGAIRASASGD